MSTKPTYKTTRKYKCPYCGIMARRVDLINHVDAKHESLLPEGYTATRAVYDSVNGKNYGICMICKEKVYEWNEKISRYNNLCNNPKCRETVRKNALERHMRVYNKPTLLGDPMHQEKMLAARKISGSYTFSDGGKITYTGTYEKKALEFMDKVLNIPSKDIQAPGPILEYKYGNETHYWITDIYYIPANLVIEVKDGGDNPNTRTMTAYREKQVAKEVMITDCGTYNYLRLTNNDFSQLLAVFADMKAEALETPEGKNPKLAIHVNESVFRENKSELNKDFKSKKRISLSSFKKIHITQEVIDKFKNEYPDLKHVRCKDTKEYTCDGYMWLDKNGKLVCHVGSCQYTDDKTRWIVSLEVVPEYRGCGLSEQVLDYAVNTMRCKFLSVNKNNKVAKYVYDKYGFKVYQQDKNMYYMKYGVNIMNEEVGGLPPYRPPQAYVVPIGTNNIFDGFGYSDTDMDYTYVSSNDGFEILKNDVFRERHGNLPKLYPVKQPSKEVIDEIHNAITENSIRDPLFFIEKIMGVKLNCWQEIFVRSNLLRVYDEAREEKVNQMITNAVVHSSKNINGKDITIGSVNTDPSTIYTKGYVSVCMGVNGYYAQTPKDFYLVSEYFPTKEALESSDVVNIMDNVYRAYWLKKEMEDDSDE